MKHQEKKKPPKGGPWRLGTTDSNFMRTGDICSVDPAVHRWFTDRIADRHKQRFFSGRPDLSF